MTNTPKTAETYAGQFDRKYGEFATKFEFGSNPSAEIWNGRLAMVGFLIALLIELTTGEKFIHYFGL